MSSRRCSPVRRRSGWALAVITAVALIGGCAAPGADDLPPSAAPSRVATDVVPEPGRTIDAAPAANADETLAGYRVAVVAAGSAPGSVLMLETARAYIAERGGEMTEFTAPAAEPGAADAALMAALEATPDLIIGVGEDVVDAFSFETPQRLGQQFLLVGAQLAEPTENVTAVIWEGATSRGSAASADQDTDAGAITAPRVKDALAVGLESVRGGQVGVVLSLRS